MGYIKEPEGINFIVDPTPLTMQDRKKISEIIAYYKATGRKVKLLKSKKQLLTTPSIKKNAIVYNK